MHGKKVRKPVTIRKCENEYEHDSNVNIFIDKSDGMSVDSKCVEEVVKDESLFINTHIKVNQTFYDKEVVACRENFIHSPHSLLYTEPKIPDSNLDDLQIANMAIRDGRNNADGLKIYIKTTWNIALFESLCTSDYDKRIAQFLKYGWPLNRDKSPLSQTWENHGSANKHPEHVTKYLLKEMSNNTMIGPFVTSPFPLQVTGISPMSTRPKKLTEARRIIVDLSWPLHSFSVNSGIPKDVFLNQPIKLIYPTVDLLCKRAAKIGPTALRWKKDAARAFRLLPLDPNSWSKMGICWMHGIMFDKMEVMGCRSAPYACQSTTNVIRHFMKNLEYIIYNYIDDFMSVDVPRRAWSGFHTLANLLRDLGFHEAIEKSVSPTHIIEFLGILFDLLRMIISIPDNKLQEIKNLLKEWRVKRYMTLKELQSITGKLQFVSMCVRPGRVFITRLYNTIGELIDGKRVKVTNEVRKDIEWWHKFLHVYNGSSIMWLVQRENMDELMATDACLAGIGGFSENRFFHSPIPEIISVNKKVNIAHLEMWAIIIAVKVWAKKISGVRFVIGCDNKAVGDIINFGRSCDAYLQQLLRELTYNLALNDAEMVVKFIPGHLNLIPDILSRFELHRKYEEDFMKLQEPHWNEDKIYENMFIIDSNW